MTIKYILFLLFDWLSVKIEFVLQLNTKVQLKTADTAAISEIRLWYCVLASEVFLYGVHLRIVSQSKRHTLIECNNMYLCLIKRSTYWQLLALFFFEQQIRNHSLSLGFSICLLIGFFLLLITPTSSVPHHHINLSQMEICGQTAENKAHHLKTFV